MLLPNTLLCNRYLIGERIAEGGMGAVYRAKDRNFDDAVVAVKEILCDEDWLREQFKREAGLLYALRHLALPRVIDHFTEAAGQFLVMDFIEGDDLALVLRSACGPLPFHQVAMWGDKLLDVLNYLHKNKVIHRDIKPANIKLTRTGEIMLIDFGLAKVIDTSLIKSSVQAATLAYASPEQLKGRGTDERSDLYSLAATLFHLMTNELPVNAEVREAVVNHGAPDPLKLASTANQLIPIGLASVLAIGMALDADNRPASAARFREWLQAALKESLETAPIVVAVSDERDIETIVEEVRTGVRPKSPKIAPAKVAAVAEPEVLFDFPRTEIERKSRTRLSGIRKATVLIIGLVLITAMGLLLWRVNRQHGQNNPSVENRGNEPIFPNLLPAGVKGVEEGGYEFTTPYINISGTVTGRRRGEATYFAEILSRAKLEMTFIPAGTFWMGSASDEQASENERPRHQVSVPAFFMGRYDITIGQWKTVMSDLPRGMKGLEGKFKESDSQPIIMVSWEDAQNFCRRLSQITGRQYRLPSEAEWEYAARGGTTTAFPYGENISLEVVNYGRGPAYGSAATGAKLGKTTAVGNMGVANGFGLYDMIGNVYQWCHDCYHVNYVGAPTDGGAWEEGGDERVARGGSWRDFAWNCRSADRNGRQQDSPDDFIGFRVVVSARSP